MNNSETTNSSNRNNMPYTTSVCAFYGRILFFGRYDVVKLFDVNDAKSVKFFNGVLYVGCCVVVRNAWNAHKDVIIGHILCKPFQVFFQGGDVFKSVLQVGVGIKVLNVYDVVVNHVEQSAQVALRHIQTCFNGDVPCAPTDGSECFDEPALQARLSATKGYAAASCKEIQFVLFHFVVQLLR